LHRYIGRVAYIVVGGTLFTHLYNHTFTIRYDACTIKVVIV
jgi:hypothetical protein